MIISWIFQTFIYTEEIFAALTRFYTSIYKLSLTRFEFAVWSTRRRKTVVVRTGTSGGGCDECSGVDGGVGDRRIRDPNSDGFGGFK